MSTDTHTHTRTVASGLLWIWVEAALVMTVGLIIVGGFFVLNDPTVRIVLAIMLVGDLAHLWLLHRRRHEAARDPQLRVQRERRGF